MEAVDTEVDMEVDTEVVKEELSFWSAAVKEVMEEVDGEDGVQEDGVEKEVTEEVDTEADMEAAKEDLSFSSVVAATEVVGMVVVTEADMAVDTVLEKEQVSVLSSEV